MLEYLDLFRIRLREVQRIPTITTLFGLLTKREKTSCILYFVLEEVREKIKESPDLPSVIPRLITANTMLRAAETLLVNLLSAPVNPVNERISEDLKDIRFKRDPVGFEDTSHKKLVCYCLKEKLFSHEQRPFLGPHNCFRKDALYD